MALKYRTATPIALRVSLSLLLFVLALLWLSPNYAFALDNTTSLPTLADFLEIVQNGHKDDIRGVYVDSVLALPVVQQPAGKTTYVSNRDGEVTQFGLASQYGNIGLLAHNHKAGQSFSKLTLGQEVQLVYGDGYVEPFVIKRVLQFQALEPTSPFSSFKNLDKDETLTAEQMFKSAYAGQYHLTFQTCIAADGKLSWGRLFVMAVPKKTAQIRPQQGR
ncbi:MAG TPA: hypothetical protein VFR47_31105 [Anaerolineales bacterium]|nr:hypothetical protein [Anaerolineales bacterium]